MADQQRWFKLWASAPADEHLQRHPPAIRWAWAVFGVYTKLHGQRGRVIVSPTNSVLAAEMGLPTESLISTIVQLPHMSVEGPHPANGEVTVTWKNWIKYQEDSTVAERVARLRSKRRGEEKRSRTPLSPLVSSSSGVRPAAPPRMAVSHPDGFARFWTEYPRKVGQPRTLKAWRSLKLESQQDAVLGGVTRWRAWWVRQQTPKDRVPYPATWLNDRRWENDPGGDEEDDAYAKYPRN